MSGIGDFLGTWDLARLVEDHRTGVSSRFQGHVELTARGGGALYHESGSWRAGPYAGMAAEQRYLWDDSAGVIAVRFSDGRAFHLFDPGAPAQTVHHWCDPDDYRGRYLLALPSRWELVWRVRGPAKDYVSHSVLTRKNP